jgi:RND family efflux transporter MFP subunit
MLLIVVIEQPAGAADPSAETLVLRHCTVAYARTAAVGTTTHGLLRETLVEPGDRVVAGQLLGRMRDDEARAEARLRELEAKSDIDVRLSEAKKAQADNKMKRSMALLMRSAINAEEVEMHRLEVAAAALEVERSRQTHDVAQARSDSAQAFLRACTLVSPHGGIVAEVKKHAGEPVMPNEVLFKIVDDTRIEVTAFADVSDVWRLRQGQPVRIIPEIPAVDLAVEREVFEGRVAYIDTQIDPLTRTCKVLVRVDNRGGLLRAGLETRMEIDPLPAPPAPPKPVNAPAPVPAPGGTKVGMSRP